MRRQKQKNVALVAAMATAGITGRELAVKTGISPVTISHAINCRTDPKPGTALAIAKALGTTPAALELEGGAA